MSTDTDDLVLISETDEQMLHANNFETILSKKATSRSSPMQKRKVPITHEQVTQDNGTNQVLDPSRLENLRGMLYLTNMSKPSGVELLGETAMYLKQRNGALSNSVDLNYGGGITVAGLAKSTSRSPHSQAGAL